MSDSSEAELFFKRLSMLEQAVLDTLLASSHGIGVKTIQGQLASRELEAAVPRPALTKFFKRDPQQVFDIDSIPIETRIAAARKFGLSVPSHVTIDKVLVSMEKAGWVTKRSAVEGSRSAVIFTVSPKVWELHRKLEDTSMIQ